MSPDRDAAAFKTITLIFMFQKPGTKKNIYLVSKRNQQKKTYEENSIFNFFNKKTFFLYIF